MARRSSAGRDLLRPLPDGLGEQAAEPERAGSDAESVAKDLDGEDSGGDSEMSLPGDLDEDALTAPAAGTNLSKKRLKRHAAWFCDGPRSLPGVLSTTLDRLKDVLKTGESLGMGDVRQEMKDLLNMKVVATTCYSGTGCFEAVASQCFNHLKGELGSGAGRLTHYSATELMPAAKGMLLNDGLDGGGLPEHVFNNVLGRVQPRALQKLKAIECARLHDYTQATCEFKIGAISKAGLSNIAEKHGKAMMNEMLEILQNTEFNATDYCVKHKTQCFISPRDVKELAGDYWIECSGNTCCPWVGDAPPRRMTIFSWCSGRLRFAQLGQRIHQHSSVQKTIAQRSRRNKFKYLQCLRAALQVTMSRSLHSFTFDVKLRGVPRNRSNLSETGAEM